MLAQLLMIEVAKWSAARAQRLPADPVHARELLAREIKTHREAIALYEHESRFADAELRTFARRILPQLRQHLSVLESLNSEKLNGR